MLLKFAMRTERLNFIVFNFVKFQGHSTCHAYSVDLHDENGNFTAVFGLQFYDYYVYI